MSNSFDRRRVARFCLAGTMSVVLAGCGCFEHDRYSPNENEARKSLEAVLRTWRAGRPSTQVEATPPVRVFDSSWLAGQQVEAYEILDQKPAEDGTQRFNVRLTMKKTRKDKEVQYVVHGRNPVWVYRAEDYQRAMNMDNNPLPRKRRGS